MKPGKLAIYGLLVVAITTGVTFTAMSAGPVDSSFSYQGHLQDDGASAEGPFDLKFELFDEPSAGIQIGGTELFEGELVSGGLFSVVLDFGTAFDGQERWLEMSVCDAPCPDPGDFDVLEPRQQITAAPYASYSLTSGTMPWDGLSGVPVGLDDGDDDTLYSGENGVVLTGNRFSIDFDVVQARVTQSCNGNSSIRSIAVDGSVVCQSENDPQVGSLTTNSVPRWNGSSLTSGSITDNGNVGINDTQPDFAFDVSGGARINLPSSGTFNDLIVNDEGGSPALVVENFGSVGIGTTGSAGKALTVDGNASVSGSLDATPVLAKYDLDGMSLRVDGTSCTPRALNLTSVSPILESHNVCDISLTQAFQTVPNKFLLALGQRVRVTDSGVYEITLDANLYNSSKISDGDNIQQQMAVIIKGNQEEIACVTTEFVTKQNHFTCSTVLELPAGAYIVALLVDNSKKVSLFYNSHSSLLIKKLN